MLRITELKLPLDHPDEALRPAIVQRLGIEDSELLDFSLFKRSYDARKKSSEMHFIYTIDCELRDEAALLTKFSDDRHISVTPDTAYKPVGMAPENLAERPLVVGFGPCGIFAELHIGLGVEHVLAPQAPGVLGALAHLGAAFQHDRLESGLGQNQRGEDPAGAEADHQRALVEVGRRLADRLVGDVRGGGYVVVVGEFGQQRGFVAHAAVDGVDELQLAGFLAGVVAALEQAEVEQIVRADPQALDYGRAQGFFGVIERQLEFGDTQHEAIQDQGRRQPGSFGKAAIIGAIGPGGTRSTGLDPAAVLLVGRAALRCSPAQCSNG